MKAPARNENGGLRDTLFISGCVILGLAVASFCLVVAWSYICLFFPVPERLNTLAFVTNVGDAMQRLLEGFLWYVFFPCLVLSLLVVAILCIRDKEMRLHVRKTVFAIGIPAAAVFLFQLLLPEVVDWIRGLLR